MRFVSQDNSLINIKQMNFLNDKKQEKEVNDFKR
jgi:hypothetical protein